MHSTFDVGHAFLLTTNIIGFFKQIGDNVRNIHLHDNYGEIDEHLVLGKGNIDIEKFIQYAVMIQMEKDKKAV